MWGSQPTDASAFVATSVGITLGSEKLSSVRVTGGNVHGGGLVGVTLPRSSSSRQQDGGSSASADASSSQQTPAGLGRFFKRRKRGDLREEEQHADGDKEEESKEDEGDKQEDGTRGSRGEAGYNREGVIRIVSANITSLAARLSEINSIAEGADILCLQEVGITEHAKVGFAKAMNIRGWSHVVWGRCPPPRKRRGFQGDQAFGAGGVAIFSRQHIPLEAIKVGGEVDPQGRVVAAAFRVNGCRAVVYNVYGHSGARNNPKVEADNEDLLMRVMVDASRWESMPVFLTGDFNTQVQDSKTLSTVIQKGIFIDALDSFGCKSPTFYGSWKAKEEGKGSRIDLSLANLRARHIVQKAGVGKNWIAGGHYAVWTDITAPDPKLKCTRWDKPRPFRVLGPNRVSSEKEAKAASEILDCEEEVGRAIAAKNGNKAWRLIELSLDEYLGKIDMDEDKHLQGQPKGAGPVYVQKPLFRRDHAPRNTQEACDEHCAQRRRYLRRLQEMAFKLKKEGPKSQGEREMEEHLLEKIREGAGRYLSKEEDAAGYGNWCAGPPTAEKAEATAQRFEKSLRADEATERRAKQNRFRQKVNEDEKEVWKQVRDIISTNKCGNPNDTIARIMEVWVPIFRREDIPDGRAFREHNEEDLHWEGPAIDIRTPTAEELMKQAAKMSISSTGPDGRAVSELKEAPIQYWRLVAKWWEALFQDKDLGWPDSLKCAHTVMIPKDPLADLDDPRNYRPITILSASYRLFGAIMYRKLLPWQESWIPGTIIGGRQGESQDIPIAVALAIEAARMDVGEEVLVVSTDYSKFFDNLSWEVIQTIGGAFGLPREFLEKIGMFITQIKRRIMFQGVVGEEFLALNGVPQGDPLSIVWCNLITGLWARKLHRVTPEVTPFAYIDDKYLICAESKHRALQRAIWVTEALDKRVGSILNPTKTKAIASSKGAAKVLARINIGGHSLVKSPRLKALGLQLCTYAKRACKKTANERVAKANKTIKTIFKSKLNWRNKLKTARGKAVAQLVYGTSLTQAAASQLKKFTSASTRLLWGRGRSKRAMEMVHVLLDPGHRLHAEMASHYEGIIAFRRFLVGAPQQEERLRRIIQARIECDREHEQVNMPAARLMCNIKALGGSIGADLVVKHPVTPDFPLVLVPSKWLMHHLRDMIRYVLLKRLSERAPKERSDFRGLDPFIDYEATSRLVRKGKLKEEMAKELQKVLTGALLTQDRKYRAGQPDEHGLPPPASGLCRFCGQTDSVRHMLWDCSATGETRGIIIKTLLNYEGVCCDAVANSGSWPETIALHGIIPADPAVLEWRRERPRDFLYQDNPLPLLKVAEDNFRDTEGRVQICTDGSCRLQDMPRLRHAGWGVFGGKGSSWNAAHPLGGVVQSSERGELRAMVHVAEAYVEQEDHIIALGGVVCYLDNEWVAQTGWRILRGWYPTPKVEHGDLWLRFIVAREKIRYPKGLEVKWIPGHMSEDEVAQGIAPDVLKTLNDGADKFAKKGARKHNLPWAVVVRAKRKVAFAEDLQLFLATMAYQRRLLDEDWLNKVKEELLEKSKKEKIGPSEDFGGSQKRVRITEERTALEELYPNYRWKELEGGDVSPWLGLDIVPALLWAWNIEVAAVLWYWSSLSWSVNYSLWGSERGGYEGITWIELALDFYLATGQAPGPKQRKEGARNTLARAAAIFKQATVKLCEKAGLPRPWFGQEKRVGSLTPFGCRNHMVGITRRPKLLMGHKVGAFLHHAKGQMEGKEVGISDFDMMSVPVGFLPRRIYQPGLRSFQRMVESAPGRPPGQRSIFEALGGGGGGRVGGGSGGVGGVGGVGPL